MTIEQRINVLTASFFLFTCLACSKAPNPLQNNASAPPPAPTTKTAPKNPIAGNQLANLVISNDVAGWGVNVPEVCVQAISPPGSGSTYLIFANTRCPNPGTPVADGTVAFTLGLGQLGDDSHYGIYDGMDQQVGEVHVNGDGTVSLDQLCTGNYYERSGGRCTLVTDSQGFWMNIYEQDQPAGY